MHTQGSYLRVLSPRTTNGNNVLVDESTRTVKYREDHLPLSARRFLELYNKNLPQHLRKIIEVVKGDELTVQANNDKKKDIKIDELSAEQLENLVAQYKLLQAKQKQAEGNQNVGAGAVDGQKQITPNPVIPKVKV